VQGGAPEPGQAPGEAAETESTGPSRATPPERATPPARAGEEEVAPGPRIIGVDTYGQSSAATPPAAPAAPAAPEAPANENGLMPYQGAAPAAAAPGNEVLPPSIDENAVPPAAPAP
jgi:hypothetical protein